MSVHSRTIFSLSFCHYKMHVYNNVIYLCADNQTGEFPAAYQWQEMWMIELLLVKAIGHLLLCVVIKHNRNLSFGPNFPLKTLSFRPHRPCDCRSWKTRVPHTYVHNEGIQSTMSHTHRFIEQFSEQLSYKYSNSIHKDLFWCNQTIWNLVKWVFKSWIMRTIVIR